MSTLWLIFWTPHCGYDNVPSCSLLIFIVEVPSLSRICLVLAVFHMSANESSLGLWFINHLRHIGCSVSWLFWFPCLCPLLNWSLFCSCIPNYWATQSFIVRRGLGYEPNARIVFRWYCEGYLSGALLCYYCLAWTSLSNRYIWELRWLYLIPYLDCIRLAWARDRCDTHRFLWLMFCRHNVSCIGSLKVTEFVAV